MDLGDEELNFRPEVAREWARDMQRPRGLRNPPGGRNEPAGGAWFVLALFFGGVLLMGMLQAVKSNPEPQNQAPRPSVTQTQIRTGIQKAAPRSSIARPQVQTQAQETEALAPTVSLPTLQAEPMPQQAQLPAVSIRELPVNSPEGSVRILTVRSQEGTVAIQSTSRGPSSLAGRLPYDLDYGHLTDTTELRDAPDGNVLGFVPSGTLILHTVHVYAQPEWRWMVSYDGKYQGYACVNHDQANEDMPEIEETYLKQRKISPCEPASVPLAGPS